MTEQDWLTSENPAAMLTWLTSEGVKRVPPQSTQDGRLISERKLRLWACACCRQVWHLLTDPRNRRAVGVIEQYADGMATEAEINSAWHDAHQAATDANDGYFSLSWLGFYVADVRAEYWRENIRSALATLREHGVAKGDQADLLRRIVGNPFRPLVTEQAYLTDAHAHARVSEAAHVAWGASGLRGREGDDFHRRVVEGLVIRQRWLTPTVFGLSRTAYEHRLPGGQLDPTRLCVLADALEEAGAPQEVGMTAALRAPGPHPPGFWPLDLALGKE